MHDSGDLFLALFREKEEEYYQFKKDFEILLKSARVMCQFLPKKQTGNDLMELHSFMAYSDDENVIDKKELIKAFPKAQTYIEDFCKKQSEFIVSHCSLINYLKDIVVIENNRNYDLD